MSERFPEYLIHSGINKTSTTLITVGSGGDFATLNAAFAEARKIRTGYASKGVLVEVRQLAGFQMAEQVFVVQEDLSYVTLTSVDAEVTIVRSALNQGNGGSANNWRTGVFPAFCAMRQGKLPFINTLYNMDSSGSGDGSVGVYVFEGSKAVVARTKGVKNAGWRGCYVDGAIAYIRQTNWSGAGFSEGPEGTAGGIRGSNGSIIMARQVDCTGCRDGAYFSNTFATISDADFSDCTNYGVAVQAGSQVYGGAPIADRCGLAGFKAADGGKLILSESSESDGVYASAQNCTGNAILVEDGGELSSDRGTFSSTSTHAVVVGTGGRLNLPAATVSSTAGRGVSMSGGSQVNLFGATISGAGDAAVRSFDGGLVNVADAKLGGTLGLDLSGGTIAVVSAATTGLDGTTPYTANVIPGEFSKSGTILGADGLVTVRSTNASFTLSPSTTGPSILVTAAFTQGRTATTYDSTSYPNKRHVITHGGSGSPLSIYQPGGTSAANRIAALAPGESVEIVPDGAGGWRATGQFRRTVRRSQGNSDITLSPATGAFISTSANLTVDRKVILYDPADGAARDHLLTRNDSGAGKWLVRDAADTTTLATISANQWAIVAPLADGSAWYVAASGTRI